MKITRNVTTVCIVATLAVFAATNLDAKKKSVTVTPTAKSPKYELPKIPLLEAQELKRISDKQPKIGAIGSIPFTATQQETADMVCALEKPKECYGGYPREQARKAGWLFSPDNIFEQNELVLAPHENTKYIVGVVLRKEKSNDPTYAVQIGTNTAVYIPAHSLGKKAKK